MTTNEHTGYRRLLPFFCSPPAWILIRVDVPGLSIVQERTDRGRAVLCFLSPLDAMIEVERSARLGRQLRILRASEMDGTVFRDLDGQGLLASFHVGWIASGSKIMASQTGMLDRYTTDIYERAGDPIFFEVRPDTLEVFNIAYELAGLFAWRETHRLLQGWDEAHLREMAGKALEVIEVMKGPRGTGTGLALFDPEFVNWHFVTGKI